MTDDDVEIIAEADGGGTAFQHGFSQPVAKHVADFLSRETSNPFRIQDPRQALPPGMTPRPGEASLQPGPMAKGIASAVTPQSPTGLAIDMGTAATGGMALPARLALTAGAGALGGLFEPTSQPAMGAAKGAGAQATAEVLAKTGGWIGRKVGERKYLERMSDTIGDLLEKHLPWLKGKLNSAKDLMENFGTAKSMRTAGKTLGNVEQAITAKLKDSQAMIPLNVKGTPLSIQAPAADRLFYLPKVRMQDGQVTWEQGSFADTTRAITELQNYGNTLYGDPRGSVNAKAYRQTAHAARKLLISTLKKIEPDLGDAYETAVKRYAVSSDLTNLFQEPGIWLENGQLNLPKFKEILQRKYVDDFTHSMGPDAFNQFVKTVGGGEYTPAIGKLGEPGHLRVHGPAIPSIGPPSAMKMPGKLPVYMNPPAAPATAAISRLINPGPEGE